MKCPVCNRNLAPTLSICLTCGAMMNDSVREDLQFKIAPVSGSLRAEAMPDDKPQLAPPPKPILLEARPQPVQSAKRPETALLHAPKTSQTLVGFKNENAPLPDWRLQMQNAVRQRRGISTNDGLAVSESPRSQVTLATRGATALKAETVARQEPLPEMENADPRLAAALQRIAASRRTFLPEEAAKPVSATRPTAPKSFPFNVVTPTPSLPVGHLDTRPQIAERPKPAMVTPLRMEKKLDTNKLPPLETVVTDAVEKVSRPDLRTQSETAKPIFMAAQSEFSEINRILINADKHEGEPDDTGAFDEDEIEDLAPFSMRFNAGLFDLIIGIFATMIVLSPIALSGRDWLNVNGVLTFAATCAAILFIYMTLSIGFLGKTLGMRLFSLELVDAEENEYPTLHQAAVNSALYILSLALGGAGFLTVFFNEEKRAAHDLLSGTIIVREF